MEVVATPDEVLSAAFELLVSDQAIPPKLIDQLSLNMVNDFVNFRLHSAESHVARPNMQNIQSLAVRQMKQEVALARANMVAALGVPLLSSGIGAMPLSGLPKTLGQFSVGALQQAIGNASSSSAIGRSAFGRGVGALRGLASQAPPRF